MLFKSFLMYLDKSKGIVKKVYQKSISLNTEKERLNENLDNTITIVPTDNQKNKVHKAQARKTEKDNKTEQEHNINKKRENLQEENKDSKRAFEKASSALETATISKEKNFSVRLLRTHTKEEVLNLYHKGTLQFK